MKFVVRKIRKQEKYILKSKNQTGDVVSTNIFDSREKAYEELRKRVKEEIEKEDTLDNNDVIQNNNAEDTEIENVN